MAFVGSAQSAGQLASVSPGPQVPFPQPGKQSCGHVVAFSLGEQMASPQVQSAGQFSPVVQMPSPQLSCGVSIGLCGVSLGARGASSVLCWSQ